MQALVRSSTPGTNRRSILLAHAERGASAVAALGTTTLAAARMVSIERPRNEPAHIAARYGSRIVRGSAGTIGDHTVVDVEKIKHLVRIASRHDAFIRHESDCNGDRYVLRVRGTVYRYIARPRVLLMRP